MFQTLWLPLNRKPVSVIEKVILELKKIAKPGIKCKGAE